MKSIVRTGAALILIATSAAAQTGTSSGTTKKKASAKPAYATQQDVEMLRQTLQQQQQLMQQLQQQMQQRDQQLQQTQQQLAEAQAAAKDAQAKTISLETANTEQQTTVTQLKSDLSDVKLNMTNAATSTQEDQKRVATLEGVVSRFRFTGDVRVRYENFFQDALQDRNRVRIRLRFGVEGKLGQDFIGGFQLASGGLNDPTSTNSSLGDSFQRKPIGIDKGYITYSPLAHKWLSLTGGKFAYTWIRTNEYMDPDINPEGFSQKVSLDLKNKMVKNVTFVGLQMVYNEVQNQANNATLPTGTTLPRLFSDSWAFGGQISARLQLTPSWTMVPSFSAINWNRPNILVNGYAALINGGNPLSNNGSINPAVLATTGFFPNAMTNSVCGAPASAIGGTGTGVIPYLCSSFLPIDFILNNTIKTKWAKLPVGVLGEYLYNASAANNRRHLYKTELSVGRTTNVKEFQVGYSWVRSEQDSVISSWAESDQRWPTNTFQHKIWGVWKVAPNTTLGYTQWIGRTLDTGVPNTSAFGFTGRTTATPVPYGYDPLTKLGGHEPWLKRGQLDLIYTF
jgi:hypothetical protein